MIPVKPHIAEGARIGSLEEYQRLYRRSIEDSEGFWLEQAERLQWFELPTQAGRWDFERAEISWFTGGRLNASVNCVDRHLEARGDKTAILWAADEPGRYEPVTYRQLHRRVGRMANVLKAHGVERGDRVCIYLPMIPDLVYTMLACARIGAVHSVVFAGFSAESLRDRILDAECALVVTANEGLRGGRTIPLKQTVDEAVEGLAGQRARHAGGGVRAGVDGGRGPALHPLYLRLHGQAEGRVAHHGRLPGLRRAHP
jgi:acetyl-CoA synthetase